jgi:hypothetical protein
MSFKLKRNNFTIEEAPIELANKLREKRNEPDKDVYIITFDNDEYEGAGAKYIIIKGEGETYLAYSTDNLFYEGSFTGAHDSAHGRKGKAVIDTIEELKLRSKLNPVTLKTLEDLINDL